MERKVTSQKKDYVLYNSTWRTFYYDKILDMEDKRGGGQEGSKCGYKKTI